MNPKWLDDAVFYEIYPQSFYDANGEGIGDFEGIIQKLDYISSLGCNALWIHPCFDSPFSDAGYDVRDYKKTAPRYGTNNDLMRLFFEARGRGMRVLLDLVPGHTSEEHPWFQKSREAAPNEYWNRYIWTDKWWKKPDNFGFISGVAERDGAYIVNFFKCQPALNYGFLNPSEAWQLPMDHPGCIATKEALKDIMRFWLDLGCDGYRVDMAFSLVKNDDENKTGTSSIWKEIRAMLDAEYPEAAFISEWGKPWLSIPAGFHADFLLPFKSQGFMSLVRNNDCFFKKTGSGDIISFWLSSLDVSQTTHSILCRLLLSLFLI
jgi:maltose alpha-D-glucosyltransferase/alpha-amylase